MNAVCAWDLRNIAKFNTIKKPDISNLHFSLNSNLTLISKMDEMDIFDGDTEHEKLEHAKSLLESLEGELFKTRAQLKR